MKVFKVLDNKKFNRFIMQRFLVFVFLCGQLTNEAILPSQEGEYCEGCSKHFDDMTAENGALRQKILAIEPLKVKGVGACSDCVFTGVHDFKRLEGEEHCVTKSPTGATIRHLAVEFRNVTGYCTCQFSSDPIETAFIALKTLSNPILSKCFIGKLASNFQESDLFPSTIETDDIKHLEKCLPTFARALTQKQTIPKFKLGGNWQNAKFKFDLVTKPGGKQAFIQNTHILQEEATGYTQTCEGPDLITDICKCTTEGRYMGHFFMQLMKVGLPCSLEESGQFAIPEFLNDMACPA